MRNFLVVASRFGKVKPFETNLEIDSMIRSIWHRFDAIKLPDPVKNVMLLTTFLKPRAEGEPGIFLVWAYFLILKQCLRQLLGYWAPLGLPFKRETFIHFRRMEPFGPGRHQGWQLRVRHARKNIPGELVGPKTQRRFVRISSAVGIFLSSCCPCIEPTTSWCVYLRLTSPGSFILRWDIPGLFFFIFFFSI